MKVSDYVLDFLVERGISDIFMVTGGGIMHLVDSVGKHPDMRYICNYHEQACAIAAEAYARTSNGVGACLVTTGPGSTNALSGIAGAFVDSVPVIVISGQVRRNLIADYSKQRQLGPQEINIEPMAVPVTKYFKTVMDPQDICYELECAYWHATTGRPGPVWINIPLDVQSAEFDELNARHFVPPTMSNVNKHQCLASDVTETIRMLKASKRPVVIGGNGVHLGNAASAFADFVDAVNAPVLTTIGGLDLMAEDVPQYMGRFGASGQRRANYVLQNADLIISVGASMSVASVGFNTERFAPKAKRIMINIDENELKKEHYIPDLAVAACVNDFINEFLIQFEDLQFKVSKQWMEACCKWKSDYPTVTQDYFAESNYVNSYVFADTLSDHLTDRDVVLTGNALDITSVYHSFKIKKGQRVFTNINYGAMGWDLPGLVGACFANSKQRTCLVTGDGSFQFNVQELLTIEVNHLPVKIFVLNNGGYESIRATQKNFFNGRYVGAGLSSGVGNPDYSHLAATYGFKYELIETNADLAGKVPLVLDSAGPVICELNISPEQPRNPKLVSIQRPDGSYETPSLENQFPLLPKEEVWKNMHLFDQDDDNADRD